MDDEHDDDIPPEVQEGAELETETYPDLGEDAEEGDDEGLSDQPAHDEDTPVMPDDDDGDSI